jgi:hypothetical protein
MNLTLIFGLTTFWSAFFDVLARIILCRNTSATNSVGGAAIWTSCLALLSASFVRGLWLCPFIENVADRLSTLDSWSSDRYFTLISPSLIDSDRDSAVIPGITDIDNSVGVDRVPHGNSIHHHLTPPILFSNPEECFSTV